MEHCLGYAEDWALHAGTIAEEALGTIKSYVETNDKVRVVHLGLGTILILSHQDMEMQHQMNLRLVTQHEKLCRNLNDHLGGTVPFVYTTSPWGLNSSREGSIALSNGEYMTAPVQESSQSTAPIPILPPGVHALEELAPSPPISQPPSPTLSFGGGKVLRAATKMRALKACQHRSIQGVGSLSSHKESSGSAGPIGPSPKKPSSKVSSPGLEYANEYTQQVIEACPLRYADPEVIKHWMEEQVPYEVTIGMAPLDLLDESTGQKKMGLRWSEVEEVHQAEALLEEEDVEIEGLIATHIKPPVRH